MTDSAAARAFGPRMQGCNPRAQVFVFSHWQTEAEAASPLWYQGGGEDGWGHQVGNCGHGILGFHLPSPWPGFQGCPPHLTAIGGVGLGLPGTEHSLG